MPWRPGAVKRVGLKRPPDPRVCTECGCRGQAEQCHSYPEYVRRRYECKTPSCNQRRWSTYEMIVTDADFADQDES